MSNWGGTIGVVARGVAKPPGTPPALAACALWQTNAEKLNSMLNKTTQLLDVWLTLVVFELSLRLMLGFIMISSHLIAE